MNDMSEAQTGAVIVEWDIEGGYDEDDYEGVPSYEDLGLDEIVRLPDFIRNEYEEEVALYGSSQAGQSITDWLSDEYGYLHFGWSFVEAPTSS